MEEAHTYIAIDLKSFYASVECVERGLDPLTTNLVVADESRTEKTICLAVSPSLKAYGIPGRARLFEVIEKVAFVNAERKNRAPEGGFTGESYLDGELKAHPELSVSYLTAVPRMALYLKYSTRIYQIYLRFAAPEDIHVYSIDEVFLDATQYLPACAMDAREFAGRMVQEVYQETGITATAGVGTNLYLCKVAMDIVAKRAEPDANGVRIAQLDEMTYRRVLWAHRPLTDFWRVGSGYAKKLAEYGIFTMGDIARCSMEREELLYRLFGVNAELLIDHAWGWEPCTIRDVKAYRPESSSFSSGQVLPCAYESQKARLVVHEMADAAALELVEKRMVTDQLTLTVGYDRSSLEDPEIRRQYQGAVTRDHYGRKVPKHAHGTVNLSAATSSSRQIIEAVLRLYDEIVDPRLSVRRLTVTVNHVTEEGAPEKKEVYEQLDLFTDYGLTEEQRKTEQERLDRERRMQEAMLEIRRKYGKNAVLKGMNFEEGATGRSRNQQIGGHRA